MRKLLLVIATLGCLAIVVVGSNAGFIRAQDAPRESKVQPKEVMLGQGQPVRQVWRGSFQS